MCSHVFERVRRRFPASERAKPYRNRETFVHVLYGDEMTLHLRLPDKPDEEVVKLAGRLVAGPIEDVRKLVEFLGQMERQGRGVTVYPDAEELIQRQLFQQRMSKRMEAIRGKSADHPLRSQLLKIPLLPYQLEGIAFAAGNGRAVLADDMGLGKTIQGVGTAEMLAREAGINKVLVVCPASLKSQWRNEIQRFCDRSVQLVVGGARKRAGTTTTTPSSRFATTSRCSATSWPWSAPAGPDHPRRGTADQELAVENRADDQGPSVAICLGPQRHAAGEPIG